MSPGRPEGLSHAHPRRFDPRVGISGWTYAPWRGVFYPKGLPQNASGIPAGHFRTIEINGTFYGMQRPEAFEGWAARCRRISSSR